MGPNVRVDENEIIGALGRILIYRPINKIMYFIRVMVGACGGGTKT